MEKILDGDEWSTSHARSFTTCETAPGTPLIGRWVGLRASQAAVAKKKIHFPCREWNPSHPARSLVTILTELSRILIDIYI
jgi:hypothetical protein